MTLPNFIHKAVDIVFDAVDAGHTTANTAILVGGMKVSHPAEAILSLMVLISFIGLIWRACRWIARRRREKLVLRATALDVMMIDEADAANPKDD